MAKIYHIYPNAMYMYIYTEVDTNKMYGCTVKKHFYELQNNIDEIYRLFIQIHLKYDVCLAVQLHITKYLIFF